MTQIVRLSPARLRMIGSSEERRQAPERPSVLDRHPVLKHPAALAVIAALVALVSSLITSVVTTNGENTAYWRDTRLQVYSDYLSTLQAINSQSAIARSLGEELQNSAYELPVGPGAYTLDEVGRSSVQLTASVATLQERYRPMMLVGGEVVRGNATLHYYNAEAMALALSDVYGQLKRSGRVTPASAEDLSAAMKSYDGSNWFDFTTLLREELGLE